MGALLTLCASDEPSKEELKRELETKKTEIIWINMRLKEINAALRQHQDKCRNLAATAERCAAYDSLIKSKVATAKQIMSSKLHLTYMDDSVEENISSTCFNGLRKMSVRQMKLAAMTSTVSEPS